MEKRRRGQPEVNPQEFFNPITPRVERPARPVAQVAHAQPPSKTGQMITQFVPQISQSATSLLGFISDKKEQAGLMSALQGEERPESASDAFIRGFERYNAMAKVSEYSRAVHDLYLNSGDLIPEEFTQAREEIDAEFLVGATEEFMKRFVPKADEIATRYDKKIIEDQRAHLVHDHLQDTRQRVEVELELLSGRLEEDPSLHRGQELRRILTEIQNDSKGLKLVDRNRISQEALEVVGRWAIKNGDPDLIMEFISEKDESGFALKDSPVFGETALNYYDTAVKAQAAQVNAEQRQAKEEHKAMMDATEKVIIEHLEIGTPESLQKAERLLWDTWGHYSPTTFRQHLQRLYEQSDNAYFARVSDPHSYAQYQNSALQGAFTPEMQDMASQVLSRSDYTELLKQNNIVNDRRRREGPQTHKWFEDMKATILDKAVAGGAKDPLGKLADTPNAVARKHMIQSYMNRKYAAYLAEHPNDTVPYELIVQWGEEGYDGAVKKYPIKSIHKFHNSSSETQGPAASPETLEQKERNEWRMELENQ